MSVVSPVFSESRGAGAQGALLLPSDPCVTWDECVYGTDPEEGFTVYDRTRLQTPPRVAIQRRAAAELGVYFTEIRVLARWGRLLTRQEVWDAHGSVRWLDLWTSKHGAGYYFGERGLARGWYSDAAYGVWVRGGFKDAERPEPMTVPDPPDEPPPAWLPEEDYWPTWKFCDRTAKGATPLYIVEVE